MSKRAKQKRSSPYRQRAINPIGGLSLISNAWMSRENMSDEQTVDLSVANWVAFNNMTLQSSSEFDWNIVTGALNMAMVLAEGGIGDEHMDLFLRALDGTFRAKLRGEKTGVWRFDGEALNNIRTALELHDQQCKLSTRMEMVQTIQTVRRRVDDGHVYRAEAMAA